MSDSAGTPVVDDAPRVWTRRSTDQRPCRRSRSAAREPGKQPRLAVGHAGQLAPVPREAAECAAKGAFERQGATGYDHYLHVTELTGIAGGRVVEHADQGRLMDASSFDRKSASPTSLTSPWSVGSSGSHQSYRTAAMRALVIAVVLLGVLALIVLI